MSGAEHISLRIVLYEGPGGDPWPVAERYGWITALLEKGHALSFAREPLIPAEWLHGPVLILTKPAPGHPWTGEAQADGPSVRVLDPSRLSPEALVLEVDRMGEGCQSGRPGEWKPWFPVIDYDRCTNCMQCLSFCLFGVYGVDANQRIAVQSSEQCKTNCPACARVCPEAAIVFPKYKSGPINGEAVSEADVQREKMKIDISALLGGDVYHLLRERNERARSRFSKERDAGQALKERQKCLQQLIEAGDIPPEVLASLPSAEEIQRRAQEALARAQTASAKSDQ